MGDLKTWFLITCILCYRIIGNQFQWSSHLLWVLFQCSFKIGYLGTPGFWSIFKINLSLKSYKKSWKVMKKCLKKSWFRILRKARGPCKICSSWKCIGISFYIQIYFQKYQNPILDDIENVLKSLKGLPFQYDYWYKYFFTAGT